MNSDLTFVFDEDGKAHALKEGKVVASADSVEELETMMREADSAAAFSTKLEMPDAKKTQEAQALGADDDEDEDDEGKEASVKEADLLGDVADKAKSIGQGAVDAAQAALPNTAAPAAPAPLAAPAVAPPMAAPVQPGAVQNGLTAEEQQVMAANPGMMQQKLQSVKESGCDCWDGYERVPGTKPCAEGSCQKCDDHRKKEKESATHVVTPNGLKGRILGKTKDVWGDTVTVRFENGRIVQFPVSDTMKFATEEEEGPESPVAALRERLEAPVDKDRASLLSRVAELKAIRNEVAEVMSKGASYDEEIELDSIAVEAAAELNEVGEALEHLASDDIEAFKPFEPKVVEQASVGTQDDGTWLDDTFGRMVSEANATDFDQLMAEGPEAFIVELDSAALADAGVTREMASSFIQEKTAGANPDARTAFEAAWIDRVEALRREELVNRKTKAKKEAAAESDTSNLPDDVLFG